jgi:hypothetical protein
MGPTQGVKATANAAPATRGPPDPARRIRASARHSLLSTGTNGVRTKNRPRATISAPATSSSVSRWWARVEPIPVAVMPSATNMTVNDRQKTIAGIRTRDSRRSPVCISATDTPLTADR